MPQPMPPRQRIDWQMGAASCNPQPIVVRPPCEKRIWPLLLDGRLLKTSSMTHGPIKLEREKETLLITLYGKALESRLPDSVLRDTFAASAVERINYNFRHLKVTRDMAVGLACRAALMDKIARSFIARHDESVVLNLGCGFDSRILRIDPSPNVIWYDVDYPDVIELRSRIFPEQKSNTLLGVSVTDDQWLGRIPSTHPVLVVAEGLVMYLDEAEVNSLFSKVVERFRGGEACFDALSKAGIWLVQRQASVRATGAKLKWGYRHPDDLERIVSGIRLIESLNPYTEDQLSRFSFGGRVGIRLMSIIPGLGGLGRILRYEL